MTDISLRDFLFKFCDEYQLISVTIVTADNEWIKFTNIRSMPVLEVVFEEKFKDILEMNVLCIRTIYLQEQVTELSIDVKEKKTMSNEKMKVGLSFNGKSVEVELTQEQLVALGLVEEKKKTGYERVEPPRKVCWTVMSNGYAMPWPDSRLRDVNKIYEQANYYSSQTVAENNARADKLMRQLRRFAAENGGIPSAEDWKKGFDSRCKRFIFYNYTSKKLDYCASTFCRDCGTVYFNSIEACEKAIEEFKDELIWYFTEYQAMLY